MLGQILSGDSYLALSSSLWVTHIGSQIYRLQSVNMLIYVQADTLYTEVHSLFALYSVNMLEYLQTDIVLKTHAFPDGHFSKLL
jgi:hypothetical protein